MGILIRIENVSFTYPNGVQALKDVSLSVNEGDFLLITGENGSGKTTLLWLMAGLIFPQKGIVLFEGKPLTERALEDEKFSLWFRRRVGILFQEPDVQLFSPTVGEDIAFGPARTGLDDVQGRVMRAADLMDITDLLGRPPYHLSWGQKRRAAMATLLSMDHEVLLLDEPMAGLDTRGKRTLLDVLERFRSSGKTVVAVSHEDSELGGLFTRKISLSAL
ncbi:MAG: ABC transporter ATP-binding protein [candidate division WOR-3 bacterium]